MLVFALLLLLLSSFLFFFLLLLSALRHMQIPDAEGFVFSPPPPPPPDNRTKDEPPTLHPYLYKSLSPLGL